MPMPMQANDDHAPEAMLDPRVLEILNERMTDHRLVGDDWLQYNIATVIRVAQTFGSDCQDLPVVTRRLASGAPTAELRKEFVEMSAGILLLMQNS